MNAVNWFEIPAVDFDRAVSFYQAVIGKDIRREEFMGMAHGFIPSSEEGVGGAIVKADHLAPQDNGVIIYLNAENQINEIVARATQAGGKIAMPVTSIGEQGHIALIIDSEGNRVGFHAPLPA